MKKQNVKLNAVMLGAALGALAFLLLYGTQTLNVMNDEWIRAGYVEEDIIQSYAAWQYYRNAAWQFPLLWLDNVALPAGASAAFADPFPLLIIFFKLISPLLPQTFQYFGIAALMNFTLQGAFAALLLTHFKLSIKNIALAVPMFLFMPVFVERAFRHTALNAQWIILASLCLYFETRRRKSMPIIPYVILFIIIPSVHAYFIPMAFALMCAAALDNIIATKRFAKPLLLCAGCTALSLITARALGVLMPHMSVGGDGFGSYSMNLNALFNPRSMDLYVDGEVQKWSLLLPTLPQGYHQYDGFNYLGAGVLLASLIMFIYYIIKAAKNRSLKFAANHAGLIIACAGCTVFAVSNVVTFGESTLFTLPLPQAVLNIFSAFRASGRMFWVVGYTLLLSIIVFISRRFKGRGAVVVLAALLIIQLADLSPALIHKAQYFRENSLNGDPSFETAEWQTAVKNASEVKCLGNMFDYRLAESLIRYNKSIKTDIIFFSRGNYDASYQRYDETLALLQEGSELQKGVLYICSEREFAMQLLDIQGENAAYVTAGKFYAIYLT